MPRSDGDQRRHPALRRTRTLLWCQLGAGLCGLAATAAALLAGGPMPMITGWWPVAGPLLTAGVALALLAYLVRAQRPRRMALIALLLLPAVLYVGDAALAWAAPGGLGQGFGGDFGWFAYSSSPAASMRAFAMTAELLTAGLWATMLANLVSVANAVLLIVTGREGWESAGS